ncbi:MAG: AMP-binding protein [candidate division WOR-3 bacterium]
MNEVINYEVAWVPDDGWIENSNVYKQMEEYGFKDYEEFLERSFYDYEWFWSATFKDLGFLWFERYSKVLDLSGGKPWPKWFVGGKLNWTYNALDKNPNDKVALVWEGEDGEVRKYTYGELLTEVNKLCNVLRDLGVKEGDSVGIYLPFIPEVAISLLAISRIGATVIPLFSGFGPQPIIVRLKDADAKVVITTDISLRKGSKFPMLQTLRETYKEIPTLEHVLVLRRDKSELMGFEKDYSELLERASPRFKAPAFDSDHRFMIIYTSGTTGKPKGAVHVHGGFMIKAAQDMFHLFDIKPNDTITWITDIGWMMGPWLIGGGLINGATVFMFEGIPSYPTPDRLWKMVERHNITILGITPTLIRSLMKEGDEWVDKYNMENLRMVGSTGEPWDPKSWWWTYEKVLKGKKPIINYSGGTEISGGILGCVVVKPIKPTSFNTPAPGVHAVALDEDGKEVIGEVALLGVKNVNPGMTRGFWRDEERYLNTYWSKWKDIWFHGDLVYVDGDGFWYILGRADDTLKIAGKRVGPSELEALANEHPAVVESAAIGVPDDIKGQVAVIFAVLKEGVSDTERVKKEIMENIVNKMGKALAPKDIIFVSGLPKTRNAKVMRRLIRAAYLGEPLGDTSALVNPEVLDEIRQKGK